MEDHSWLLKYKKEAQSLSRLIFIIENDTQ